MKKITFLFSAILAVILSGCTVFTAPSPTPTFPPTAAATSTSSSPYLLLVPTQEAPASTPTPAAIITAQPTPITPIGGSPNVDNPVLRAGPGMLFDKLGIYTQNSQLTIYGKAPGGQWLFVVAPDNRAGWINKNIVDLQGDISDLADFRPVNADVITGHVKTTNGAPMSGIAVALAHANQDLGAGPDTTVTDSTGTFYLYVPKNTSGNYSVGPNGYDCKGNMIIGKCELPYKFPSSVQSFMLPDDLGISFEFVLEHN